MLEKARIGRLRGVVLVGIALIMGANLLSPAVAHVTRRLNHLFRHLDKRYVNVGEKATSAATADTATNATNADKVDNLDANALNRGAFVAPADIAPVPTLTGTIATTSITAPVRGILIIQAGADWSNTTAEEIPFCFVRVNGTLVDGSFRVTANNGSGTTNEHEDCSTEGAVVVNAGTHTVDFRWDVISLATNVFDPTLIVQFVPFGGTGATPRQIQSQDGGDVLEEARRDRQEALRDRQSG